MSAVHAPFQPNHFEFNVRNSIGLRLIAIVFSIYFGVTLTVTLAHMILEFQNTQSSVVGELKDLGDIFAPGLAQSLWNEDDPQVRSILRGMLKVPVIVSVKIEDPDGQTLYRFTEDSTPAVSGDESAQGQPLAGTVTETSIFYQSQISLARGEKTVSIGTLTLYSSNEIVFEKVRYGFLFIIVNSIIKTVALWWIFTLAGKRILSRPLFRAAQVATLTAEGDLTAVSGEPSTKKDEISLLLNSLRRMVGQLGQIVRVIRTSSDSVVRQNEELGKITSFVSDGLNKMTAQSADMNASFQILSRDVSFITTEITEVSNDFDRVSSTTQQLNEQVLQKALFVQETLSTLSQVSAQTQSISEADLHAITESVSQTVQSLQQITQQVSNAANRVRDITQTNRQTLEDVGTVHSHIQSIHQLVEYLHKALADSYANLGDLHTLAVVLRESVEFFKLPDEERQR